MAARKIDPIELLARLVAARSLSGEEDAAADVVAAALRDAGFEPRRVERNVWASRGSGARGLIFNSHLDTVPPAPGWTRDPWRPAVEEGRLYGLGANDAKSCIAAMLAAFAALPDPGERGRVVFAATAEEEGPAPGAAPGSSCRGLEIALPRIVAESGPLAGGVIGEPTSLRLAHAQRGRMVLRLVAEGRAGHASRPWEGVNAIQIAAADIERVSHLPERIYASEAAQRAIDELGNPFGKPTITPTLIEGGTRSNVIPARCAVTLDVRTTPLFDGEQAIREIQAVVRSGVVVVNARFRPILTPKDSDIFKATAIALGYERTQAGTWFPRHRTSLTPPRPVTPRRLECDFFGVSDLFHLVSAGVPGVILGPGESAQSHQADEFVSVDAVREAATVYARIAEEFFRS